MKGKGNILGIRALTVEDVLEVRARLTMPPEVQTEIGWYVEHRGLDKERAEAMAVMLRLLDGDLRPLRVHLAAGRIHRDVVDAIGSMIDSGHLVIRKKGRPKKPECPERDIMIAREYEAGTGSFAARVGRIAVKLGVSKKTVEAAITKGRKGEVY